LRFTTAYQQAGDCPLSVLCGDIQRQRVKFTGQFAENFAVAGAPEPDYLHRVYENKNVLLGLSPFTLAFSAPLFA
jgi:hypothetical protein